MANVLPVCQKTVTISKQFVDDKAKEQISKRVSQENKVRQIFRSLRFSKNLVCFFSCITRFEIRPFAVLPTNYRPVSLLSVCYKYLKVAI